MEGLMSPAQLDLAREHVHRFLVDRLACSEEEVSKLNLSLFALRAHNKKSLIDQHRTLAEGQGLEQDKWDAAIRQTLMRFISDYM